jgi:ABC-2 type transport system permease protein
VTTFTRTGALTRFALRRDRVRIAIWLVSLALLVVVTAASTQTLYPTQADLDQAAMASQDNPAALAFNGPAVALDTMGGQVAFQLSTFGLVMVGLMSLLMVVRLTRTEEDSGRLELVRSMAVGRHAPVASAAIVVAGMDVVVGLLTALSLVALGLPAAGSMILGASFTALGLVFVAVAAVTAQVTENPRAAGGMAGAVLGLSFVVRAIGDVGDGTLSWFSPIGIAQKTQPFGGDLWWPLSILVVLTVLLGAAAAVLASHRDFGAGLVPPRPGPPNASALLGGSLGLAVRLQRGTVLWWAFAVLVTGVVYGSLANSIDEFVADNQAIADIIASGGGSLVDSYLTTSLLVLALAAGGAALQSALRLRTEESGGRIEPLLATPTARSTWMGSHLAVAFVGSIVVLAAGGLGIGVTYAVVIGDASQVWRVLVASLVFAPAVWFLAAAAAFLFGFLPRASVAAWALLAAALIIAMFGTLLGLPSWVMDLSPFQQIPEVLVASFDVVPFAAVVAVVVGLTGLGLFGFGRRDVMT